MTGRWSRTPSAACIRWIGSLVAFLRGLRGWEEFGLGNVIWEVVRFGLIETKLQP
jgi:hypothetical protein